jgi:hypothetical protein
VIPEDQNSSFHSAASSRSLQNIVKIVHSASSARALPSEAGVVLNASLKYQ